MFRDPCCEAIMAVPRTCIQPSASLPKAYHRQRNTQMVNGTYASEPAKVARFRRLSSSGGTSAGNIVGLPVMPDEPPTMKNPKRNRPKVGPTYSSYLRLPAILSAQ